MNKNSLLKSIAIKGYDVGFGAKKHFATFDLVSKLPNSIALTTLTIGVIQLAFPIPDLANRIISVGLIFIGIVALLIHKYLRDKEEYKEAGIEINKIYQGLRDLYFKVKGTDENSTDEMKELEKEYKSLIESFYNTGITDQIMFSDWYAHYKFFVQLETDWIEEQRRFTRKDKIPLSLVSLIACGFILILIIVIILILNCS
ncbi:MULTISPECIES: SLATT domain-containing protein [Staphylococcus]|uniref:SLATT domain-containing protein n=1 Tax=Staphylococcus TaxID=1279 RepID=UPI000596B1B4|nr:MULTISPECIES: SLATT domain-containing protein [Staphylococcus]KIJ85921.1 hypothetical protein SE00_11925 [Staphylococcus saprophyticus]MDW4543345.1 SLATT domain-containing protein [Staphylococcus saprophyticus]QZZ03522.1 SLATT domain-containing protein [Staphylococcus arlettae]SUM66293.1 Uncharacterised protein [Staphylococcus saprophyticus]SUM91622.1 Uncharacterised protein [Staphylococcus saprophyticus]